MPATAEGCPGPGRQPGSLAAAPGAPQDSRVPETLNPSAGIRPLPRCGQKGQSGAGERLRCGGRRAHPSHPGCAQPRAALPPPSASGSPGTDLQRLLPSGRPSASAHGKGETAVRRGGRRRWCRQQEADRGGEGGEEDGRRGGCCWHRRAAALPRRRRRDGVYGLGGGEAMQSGWVTPGGGTGRERAGRRAGGCAVIGVRVPGKVRDIPEPLLQGCAGGRAAVTAPPCGHRNTRAGAGRSRDTAAGAAPRRMRGGAPSLGAVAELLPLGGCACSARLRLAFDTSQLTKCEKNARVQQADVKNKHRRNRDVYTVALCSSRPFYTDFSMLIYRFLMLLAAAVLVYRGFKKDKNNEFTPTNSQLHVTVCAIHLFLRRKHRFFSQRTPLQAMH